MVGKIMRRRWIILHLGISFLLVSCASETEKLMDNPNEPEKLSATGYTEYGCLLNLKTEAHERNVRLDPQSVTVSSSLFSSFFAILDHEGYRCSGTMRPPRPPFMGGDTSLYPVN